VTVVVCRVFPFFGFVLVFVMVGIIVCILVAMFVGMGVVRVRIWRIVAVGMVMGM
jgi:hypothetical protein